MRPHRQPALFSFGMISCLAYPWPCLVASLLYFCWTHWQLCHSHIVLAGLASFWFKILGIEHVDASVMATPTLASYSVLVSRNFRVTRPYPCTRAQLQVQLNSARTLAFAGAWARPCGLFPLRDGLR